MIILMISIGLVFTLWFIGDYLMKSLIKDVTKERLKNLEELCAKQEEVIKSLNEDIKRLQSY